MFGSLIRAGILVVGGSFVALVVSMAGSELVEIHQELSPGASNNDYWAAVFVDYFAAVIVAALVTLLIGSAVLHRRVVR